MEDNTAARRCLRFDIRPQQSQAPALHFTLRRKHAIAVLRNYIKRAARERLLKSQERNKVDIHISLLRKIGWKEKPLVAEELSAFAGTL